MPLPSEDTKLEVLSDHYKDSFAHLQEFRKLRGQLLLLILVVVTLLLFQIFSPKDAGNAFGQFISKKLELQSSIDISFIGSVIWFSLLALLVRYFQTNVHIERQYEYIHNLEKQLSRIYEDKAFTREGKFYLNNYPLFSNWAYILYTGVFPVMLIIIVVVKAGFEIAAATRVSPLIIFNIIVALCTLISIVLYLVTIHWKKMQKR